MLSLQLPTLAAETPAEAAPDSSIEKARASFQQGVQLFNEGSFEAAVAEFRKAYRLAPSYRILYNVAQAYYEIHDYVNSLKTFKQYISDGGSDISASRRAEVEALKQKLEGRIAYLDIRTTVDGADIRVDDVSVGISPLPFPVPVNAGPRRISASKAGYTIATRSLTVAGAERLRVNLNPPELLPHAPDPTSSVVPRNQPAKNAPPNGRGLRTLTVVSWVAAGSCAVATGVFAVLTMAAKKDFDQQLDTFPNTKGSIDSARSRMSSYAALTDGFGAATLAAILVAGGLSLYSELTEPDKSEAHARSTARTSVALLPTLGGMVLSGRW